MVHLQVSKGSPLARTVFPGDRVVALNGVHVQRMDAIGKTLFAIDCLPHVTKNSCIHCTLARTL
jgi:hypothetical protein